MISNEQISEFCSAVKRGFGTIVDSSVKGEIERFAGTPVDPKTLGKLLAVLEHHSLLDKKRSVNVNENFYRSMYKKLSENNG